MSRYSGLSQIRLKASLNEFLWNENNGLSRFDDIGLSSRDVLKIVAKFMETMRRMCEECKRCNYPSLGNIFSNLPGSSYMGCTDHAFEMHAAVDRMRPEVGFDDIWSFTSEYKFGLRGPHNWVEGVSDNPSDPKIILDTWRGCIEVQFLNAPEASWKRCFKCPPGKWPRGKGDGWKEDLIITP